MMPPKRKAPQLRPSREDEALREDAQTVLPAMMIPSFRTALAIERNVQRSLLFKTWGGIGDQVCAEPTIRFAINNFKYCDVSLASEMPELFSHLKLKEVYNLKERQPDRSKYFCLDTIHPMPHIQWEFMSHMIINCVDYPSLCALRCQIPIKDREVKLTGIEPAITTGWFEGDKSKVVAIHPGKHWQIKTFPVAWWNEVIDELQCRGKIPVIIGKEVNDGQGTVDVSSDGCIDLRGSLTLSELTWFLQRVPCVLTNDSAPLHIAASGDAWIGYVATCKHPDYISHWRKGQWSWRMQNHGKGGVWDLIDYCPNKESELRADTVADEVLRSWLPNPREFAAWGATREL